jgi:CRISPR-associated protein Cmr3
MTSYKLKIEPIDPLISRDSRPFGKELGKKARALSWLTPSVVCGSLRSHLGKLHGCFNPYELKSVEIRGPFLEVGSWDSEKKLKVKELYFPRPLDFVSDKTKGYAVRPEDVTDGGSNIPAGLKPAFIQNPPDEDFKPEPVSEFWSARAVARWLENPDSFSLAETEGLSGPVKDERVHVGIDPRTGASQDALLFSTTGLDFRVKKEGKILQLAVAVETTPPGNYEKYLSGLSSLHPLGGERRLAKWDEDGGENIAIGWVPPKKPENVSRLRMILATPAIFAGGWRPGWISVADLTGAIPGVNVRVRLVSAVTERWVPISGWSYEAKKRGIKPLRRMVPAGSVYFFETDKGIDFSDLENLWLRSVCDDEQDQKDGFGAALWGVW